MLNLTPFLLFDGECAAAMNFYRACLGGELVLTRVQDTPRGAGLPPELQDRIIFSHLKSGALEFSATDWLHQSRRPRPGNTCGLYLSGGTYLELRALFDRLAVGADPELLDDLRDLPFGSYGHLADRYGVHWFFQGERS
jgi:PhnB protein